jgi:hypothetical protein
MRKVCNWRSRCIEAANLPKRRRFDCGEPNHVTNGKFVECTRVVHTHVGDDQFRVDQPIDDLGIDVSRSLYFVSPLHLEIRKVVLHHRTNDAIQQPVGMRTGHAICCTDRVQSRSKASSFGLCLLYEESPKARNSSETGQQIQCPKTVEYFRSGRIVRLAMKRGPPRSSLEAFSFSGLQLVLLNPRKRG